MPSSKSLYIILTIATIIIGLYTRRIEYIPLAAGDALYAVMIYWGFRFLLTQKSITVAFYASVIFCFIIEFLQLVQYPLLIAFRSHPTLRLVFGQGFLWSDLVAYIVGAFLAYLIDRKLIRNYNSKI